MLQCYYSHYVLALCVFSARAKSCYQRNSVLNNRHWALKHVCKDSAHVQWTHCVVICSWYILHVIYDVRMSPECLVKWLHLCLSLSSVPSPLTSSSSSSVLLNSFVSFLFHAIPCNTWWSFPCFHSAAQTWLHRPQGRPRENNNVSRNTGMAEKAALCWHRL